MLLQCLQNAQASQIKAISCQQVLNKTSFSKMQSMLIQVGLYHVNYRYKHYVDNFTEKKEPLSDSIVGPVTLKWLTDFCENLPEPHKKDVIDSLFLYSSIKKVEPNCKATGNLAMLKQWFNGQSKKYGNKWVSNLLKECDKQTSESEQDNDPHYYQLSKESIELIAQDKALFVVLATHINTPFIDKINAEQFFMPLLEDFGANKQRYLDAILDTLKSNYTLQLNKRSFDRLAINPQLTPYITALESLKNKSHSANDVLLKAVADVLTKAVNSNSAEFPLKAMVKKTDVSPNTLAKTPAVYINKLAEQVIETSSLYTFVFDNTSFDDLKNKSLMNFAVSDKDLKKLSLLEQKAYPSEMLFKHALASIFLAEGDTKDSIEIATDKEPINNQKLTFSIDKIMQLAEQQPHINSPIANEADCGCVKERYYDNVIYNIYPGWLPSPKIKTIETIVEGKSEDDKSNKIDYTNISRIGFQGISIDKNGHVTGSENIGVWNSLRENFINQAHKHYTQADIVIELINWQKWSDKVIKKSLVTVKNSLLKSPKEKDMLWSNDNVTNLDGITLYLPKFTPEDSDTLSSIAQTFLSLKNGKPNFKVNVLLDLDICPSGIDCKDENSHSNVIDFKLCNVAIAGIIESDKNNSVCKMTDSEEQTLDYILMYLPEYTTKTKKHLRKIIEDNFTGAARRTMMNKIVPIIMPYDLSAAADFSQLEDDLVYTKHNFGGVGFWPIPLQGEAHFDAIQEKINKVLIDPIIVNKIEVLVKSILPENVCDFICTQRWEVRIVFDVMIIFLVSSIFLKSSSCYICQFIDNHYKSYLMSWASAVLLFFSMLGCDKYWQENADIAVLGVLIIIVLITFTNYIIKMRNDHLP
ncbi:hypothetical protein H4J58_03935 [Colwellia sp. MB3u-70]|uniref:hypothetical protein n=1 Tax=unclassified Colwellia TaxID=196834 RepID=UPI0015F554A3|nr:MULTISPECIES: hypothetical protein [unclassified Colwellia]MBA6293760.1 hypothetical protein [Colwellia sp. MB3u-8]MBA6306268.1 hypothetical protein [Colwellia sp. MB3u-70]